MASLRRPLPPRRSLLALLCLTLLLGACQSTPQRESTGEFIDSSVITTRVKSKLFEDPETSGFAIKVDTFKGVVQLSGFVDSAAQRSRAGELARAVPGVRSVENNLIVK